MAIPESFLNQMKCCAFNDGHIAIEPVLVKCGATVCKDCIKTAEVINCYNCSGTHETKDSVNSPIIKLSDSMVQYYLNDLLEYAKETMKTIGSKLSKESLIDELNLKIEGIENEMDIHVESLIASIHKYREECKIKLETVKEEFQRMIEKQNQVNLETVNMNCKTLDDLKKIQNEMKIYQTNVNRFSDNFKKISFKPSKFEFIKELFGDIKDRMCWGLKDSLILNAEEALSLVEMSKSKKGILLYRASRDGFTAQAFHTRCDGKTNTITIIKNNLNYVFGGYASAFWNSSNQYINDPSAFLFSLRRNGKSSNEKFTIKYTSSSLIGHSGHGPIFGGGHDINICNQSNIITGSYTNFGHSYNVPVGIIYGENSKDFLAGNYNEWKTTEIEVYQIS